MKCLFVVFCLFLVVTLISSKSVFDPEDQASVVSIYTTPAATTKTKPLDVYQQIANNIAERITSPIYRFLGINSTGTSAANKTKTKNWDKIELLDDVDDSRKLKKDPIDNEIEDREIEELSVEALKKSVDDKKPEKITLFSNYLPVKVVEFNTTDDITKTNDTEVRATGNTTVNEIDDDDDDPFEFDDDEQEPGEGGFMYYLELIRSVVQLAWSAVVAFFNSSGRNNQ